MNTSIRLLISTRLKQLGVQRVSDEVLDILEQETLPLAQSTVKRYISGTRLAKAIATSLGQGHKGGTPLSSSQMVNKPEGVACSTSNI